MTGPRALALAVGVCLSIGLASSAQAATAGVPLACPSATLCVGTDAAESTIYPTFLPTKLVMSDPRTDATTATRTAPDGLLVHDVRCPSEARCFALLQAKDAGRHAPVSGAVFDPRTGGALDAVEIPGSRLGGLDCPTVTQCTTTYAIWDTGQFPQPMSFWQATFDPANAAAATHTQLQKRGDPEAFMGGVGPVCASTTRCVLYATASGSEGTNGMLFSFDPTGSSPVAKATLPGISMGGLACPRADACVITGDRASARPKVEGLVHSVAPADLTQIASVQTPYLVGAVTCPAARCYAKTIAGKRFEAGLLTIDAVRLGDPPSLRVLHAPGYGTGVTCLLDDRCWMTHGAGGWYRSTATFDPVTGKGAPKRPDFTPASIKVTARERVSLSPRFLGGAVGYPIVARLTRESKVVDRGSFTTGFNQTFVWKVGRLKPGRYVADFTLAPEALAKGMKQIDVEIAIRVTRP
jgi:hypothetical protein